MHLVEIIVESTEGIRKMTVAVAHDVKVSQTANGHEYVPPHRPCETGMRVPHFGVAVGQRHTMDGTVTKAVKGGLRLAVDTEEATVGKHLHDGKLTQ